MPSHVLHVIPSVAPRYGGPSQAVVDMCRALMRREVDPLIVTTDADGPGRLPVEIGKIVELNGVPTLFFPRQISEAFKFSWPLAGWLARNIGAFDVVHIHAVFSHASLAAARAAAAQSVPYIVRPLGTLDPWSMRQKPIRKRLFWHLGIKDMLRRAVAIQYTTADEQRLAEVSLGLTRGVVIPLGISEDILDSRVGPEHFRRQYPQLGESPYMMMLSRLHPKKGLELGVDAFLAASEHVDRQGWHLVLAGDGDPNYVDLLKRRVAERGGDGRVLFTGWLAGRDKVSALRGAAFLALPSRQENFGIAVAEALASQVPALVSPHVNLATDIEAAEAGWVVPLEPSALEASFRRIMCDPDERARRGHAGRCLALARYAWPAVAAQLEELYGRVQRGSK
jgi:glycosyltransferase involved in cell wall biosynthesis